MDTRNAPAAANIGRVRAASQSKIGSDHATGSSISQVPRGSKTVTTVTAASATRATVPSMKSRRGGGCRTAPATPITKGATVIMPTNTDANQCSATVSTVTAGPRANLNVTAAPSDEAVTPMAAAARK